MVVTIFEMIKIFSQLFLNLMFLIQIVLMILVFLTASYWFFDLLDSQVFAFAQPIAEACSNFVNIFHRQDIEVGGVYVDGSLLLFDLCSIILVFLIAKAKYYINVFKATIDVAINMTKQQIENEFNAELQSEMEDQLKKSDNFAILIQFNAKNLVTDYYSFAKQNAELEAKEKGEEAFKLLYSVMKNIKGCKFAKTGDKMLILSDNFDNFDNIMSFIDSSIERIRHDFKSKRWLLLSYIAVDVFDSHTNFKKDIYPVMEQMLNIHHKNEAVCMGNFRIRYNLNKKQMYTSFLKGSYEVNGMNEIWALVKKN